MHIRNNETKEVIEYIDSKNPKAAVKKATKKVKKEKKVK
jgi:hypothetical protein